MDFTDNWKESFGVPEQSGVWLIWGNSGNGKTRFSLQLAKQLAKFGRVVYNSLEEGASLSLQKAIIETRMNEVANNFSVLDRESLDDLKIRLHKRRSPDIILIDSYQYTGMNKRQYIALKEEFKNKLFIFISHAEGRQPEGRSAKFVKYDADVKIWVEGYKAFPVTRFGGGEPFVIWNKGANDYWIDK